MIPPSLSKETKESHSISEEILQYGENFFSILSSSIDIKDAMRYIYIENLPQEIPTPKRISEYCKLPSLSIYMQSNDISTKTILHKELEGMLGSDEIPLSVSLLWNYLDGNRLRVSPSTKREIKKLKKTNGYLTPIPEQLGTNITGEIITQALLQDYTPERGTWNFEKVLKICETQTYELLKVLKLDYSGEIFHTQFLEFLFSQSQEIQDFIFKKAKKLMISIYYIIAIYSLFPTQEPDIASTDSEYVFGLYMNHLLTMGMYGCVFQCAEEIKLYNIKHLGFDFEQELYEKKFHTYPKHYIGNFVHSYFKKNFYDTSSQAYDPYMPIFLHIPNHIFHPSKIPSQEVFNTIIQIKDETKLQRIQSFFSESSNTYYSKEILLQIIKTLTDIPTISIQRLSILASISQKSNRDIGELQNLPNHIIDQVANYKGNVSQFVKDLLDNPKNTSQETQPSKKQKLFSTTRENLLSTISLFPTQSPEYIQGRHLLQLGESYTNKGQGKISKFLNTHSLQSKKVFYQRLQENLSQYGESAPDILNNIYKHLHIYRHFTDIAIYISTLSLHEIKDTLELFFLNIIPIEEDFQNIKQILGTFLLMPDQICQEIRNGSIKNPNDITLYTLQYLATHQLKDIIDTKENNQDVYEMLVEIINEKSFDIQRIASIYKVLPQRFFIDFTLYLETFSQAKFILLHRVFTVFNRLKLYTSNTNELKITHVELSQLMNGEISGEYIDVIESLLPELNKLPKSILLLQNIITYALSGAIKHEQFWIQEKNHITPFSSLSDSRDVYISRFLENQELAEILQSCFKNIAQNITPQAFTSTRHTLNPKGSGHYTTKMRSYFFGSFMKNEDESNQEYLTRLCNFSIRDITQGAQMNDLNGNSTLTNLFFSLELKVNNVQGAFALLSKMGDIITQMGENDGKENMDRLIDQYQEIIDEELQPFYDFLNTHPLQ